LKSSAILIAVFRFQLIWRDIGELLFERGWIVGGRCCRRVAMDA
jgi:hypothetical protein